MRSSEKISRQLKQGLYVSDAYVRGSNGVSLNSCSVAGPALQQDLVGILLRFQKNQVGIMGDIAKMLNKLA